MARPVPLGIFPEGPTDVRFLGPVLRRLVASLCAAVQVDIPEDVLDLSPRPGAVGRRETRILESVRGNANTLVLVFVHADGAGDWERALVEQCLPGVEGIRATHPARIRGVPVVPVRETEAWALVDGDAIRSVFGSRLADPELGLPERPALAEAVTDPKRRLAEVLERARPRSVRRQRDRHEGYLGLLGDEIALDRLRCLEAFQRLEADTRAALLDLGVLRS